MLLPRTRHACTFSSRLLSCPFSVVTPLFAQVLLLVLASKKPKVLSPIKKPLERRPSSATEESKRAPSKPPTDRSASADIHRKAVSEEVICTNVLLDRRLNIVKKTKFPLNFFEMLVPDFGKQRFRRIF